MDYPRECTKDCPSLLTTVKLNVNFLLVISLHYRKGDGITVGFELYSDILIFIFIKWFYINVTILFGLKYLNNSFSGSIQYFSDIFIVYKFKKRT